MCFLGDDDSGWQHKEVKELLMQFAKSQDPYKTDEWNLYMLVMELCKIMGIKFD